MRQNQLKTVFAWIVVLSIGLAGNVFAQVPSLVTQQTRLSTGGATPSYVQLRAKAGVAASPDFYSWDQAPTPAANTNYSLFLDANNNIERSLSFGPTVGAPGTGAPGYLQRVNAAGNGLDWVLPTAIVGANNGLVLDLTSNPGTATVQLGDSATGSTGQGALSSNRFVHMNGKDLSFENSGNLNLGTSAGSTFNLTIDPGTAGVMKIHDLISSTLATKLLVLGGNDSVLTRDLSSLVVADNGLTINPTGGFVELGSLATGGAPLLRTSFVTANGHDLNFDGSGNFNVGSATGVLNMTLDPGTTGFITMNDINTLPNANIDSNNRFVVLDETTNRTYTRKLTSLVNANNGLIVDNSVSPGTSTVQLGAPATGGALLLSDRFIGMSNKVLNFEGDGTYNIGTTGNIAFNVNTGTQAMTIQSASLDNTSINNFAWIDSTTHAVHRTTTAALVRQNTVNDFVAIDPTTGNIVRAISPTAGIFRGQIAGTGAFQYTSPAIDIKAGASITATVENHTGIIGAIVVQVTNVTQGTTGTFSVESSESIQTGSFINYVVMNP